MSRHLSIGQYFPGDSIIHRGDPRVKIFLTLILITAVMSLSSILGLGLLQGSLIFIYRKIKVPLSYALKEMKPIFMILLITSLVKIFTDPENILLQYGWFHMSFKGIQESLVMFLEFSVLVFAGGILTATTTTTMLSDALEWVLSPLAKLRIPVQLLVMMMTVTIRFIPTLAEEFDKIKKAQISRGAMLEDGNILQRLKGLFPILVPLILNSIRRTEELATAMESRCYRGGRGRTKYRQMKAGKVDLKLILHSIVFIGSVAVVDRILLPMVLY